MKKIIILILIFVVSAISISASECGNNFCQTGELETCPKDCEYVSRCGDAVCSYTESRSSCPIDCNDGSKIRYIGDIYHTNEQVYAMMDNMIINYPGMVSKEIIGKTLQGKNIYLYKIGNGKNWSVMFDGRLHGPEDCGTETGIEFIKWVLAGNTAESKAIKEGTTIYFIPIINLDSTRRQNARRSYSFPDGSSLNVPYGVDLNRNFPWGWGLSGSSNPNNNYEYRGISAGSEPETKAVVNAMKKYQPKAYVNIHCGMQVFRGKSNTAESQKIYYKVHELSKKMNTSTRKLYEINYANSKETLTTGTAAFPNASSWIFEISYWEGLPLTAEGYNQKWFKQALPMMIAVSNPYSVTPEIIPEPIINKTENVTVEVPVFKMNFTKAESTKLVHNNVVFNKDIAKYSGTKSYSLLTAYGVTNKQKVSAEATVTINSYSHGYIIYGKNSFLLQLRPPTSTSKPVFQAGIFSNGVWIPLMESTFTPQIGKTYKLKFVYDGGKSYLYVDGKLNRAKTITKKVDIPSTLYIYAGNSADGNRQLSAYVKDISVVI